MIFRVPITTTEFTRDYQVGLLVMGPWGHFRRQAVALRDSLDGGGGDLLHY